jgi:glycogen operon protein
MRARSAPFATRPGRSHPFGATVDLEGGGVNFSLYAGPATSVELLLFEGSDARKPMQTIVLDPLVNRFFLVWHVFVVGLQAGAEYAFRVDGPQDLHGQGDRYNRNKVLVDPYAHATSTQLWSRAAACTPDDNVATAMHSQVVDLSGYDWEGDTFPRTPMNESIIYEVHVGGFTRSPSAGVRHPGTFKGLIEKIPYLQALGVTAVELLPTCQFDEQEITGISPINGRPLTNYWGYSTLGFFCPHPGYCVSPACATHSTEFRDMVKALHRAGIEVILDMVFNHTTELDAQGPTISFRGLDNGTYYFLSPDDRAVYVDYSGVKNTVNSNHPIVTKLIVDCLEFWVRHMHVDGFRFDEGSILTRGEQGIPLKHPPVIWAIELSDRLADSKVIWEAWDASGLYQVGTFPGPRSAIWNGRYRDDIRRFVRGDPGMVGAAASRIAGSADIFSTHGSMPINSVNFITCHDGFTMNDLVSYSAKHNEANGEQNRDGSDYNLSSNYGVEGPTTDLAIDALRHRQIKNFTAILLLSRGVPMLLGGDEMRRTQQGNNNPYCQDNEISWFDWRLLEHEAEIVRFFTAMIRFRKDHHVLYGGQFYTGEINQRGLRDIDWHGCSLAAPDWNDPSLRVLSFTLGAPDGEPDLHAMLNMDDSDHTFDLPPLIDGGVSWCRAIDTSLPPPRDIAIPGQEILIDGTTFPVASKSVVVLVSRLSPVP